MTKRRIDRTDWFVALGLALFATGWAFLWAHSYPHPNLWPFLATFGRWIPLAALSYAGKVGLGLFAALVYLLMRGSWLLNRREADESLDDFYFTRFAPLCGTVAICTLPYVWREAQFMTPGWAICLMLVVGTWLWQRSRLYGGFAVNFFAHLILAFAASLTPVAGVVFAYVGISDIIKRWRIQQMHGQRKTDILNYRLRETEAGLAIVATTLGFFSAVMVGAIFYEGRLPVGGFGTFFFAWWKGYAASFWPSFTANFTLALAVVFAAVVGALALGRRVRAVGDEARVMSIVLASLLAFVALAMCLRAVDLAERRRLTTLGDFVRQTVDDAEGVKWLFTDGRFDDALRYEFMLRRRPVLVLNALAAPTAADEANLRQMAPEPGDRDLFAAGAGEVFRAWARERPDRLADAAWQLGGGIVRRFGKVNQQTCGAVLRCADKDATRFAACDDRFAAFARELLALLEKPVTHGIPFGGVDAVVAEKCDAMLWRTARIASERAETLSAAGRLNDSQALRLLMQRLDGANISLRMQGAMLERLLPTSNLVLTPQEALGIALKRADFFLAQRYANEVLAGKPNDPSAHFALGMYSLETKDFFSAARHFESVLKMKPDEPTTLNNLALAYLKQGLTAKARAFAERAARVNPKSPEIKANLAEILKAEAKAQPSK